MTIFQSFILGAIQGLSEFLPISSSGHLALTEHLLGLSDVPLIFSIFLHLATLLAVLAFFRVHIRELLFAFFRMLTRKPLDSKAQGTTLLSKDDKCARQVVIAIIIITAVTGAIGIFVKKMINSISLKIVCIGFIITACILILSSFFANKKAKRTSTAQESQSSTITKKQALAVGIAQGFGTLPGISRSGSTVAGGIFSGLDKSFATELSFVASIPSILGAFILELKDFNKDFITLNIASLFVSFVTAFVIGYIALKIFVRLIKNGRLAFFACYLIPIGILGLIFL